MQYGSFILTLLWEKHDFQDSHCANYMLHGESALTEAGTWILSNSVSRIWKVWLTRRGVKCGRAYIARLIGPGDRKSIQPMATRSDAVPYDRLHHFIGAGLWVKAPLQAILRKQANELVNGD